MTERAALLATESNVCPNCRQYGGGHYAFCANAPANRGTVDPELRRKVGSRLAIKRREAGRIDGAEVYWLGGGQLLMVTYKGARVVEFRLTPKQEQAIRRATE